MFRATCLSLIFMILLGSSTVIAQTNIVIPITQQNLDTLRVQQTLRSEVGIIAVDFGFDGEHYVVVTSDLDGVVRIWEFIELSDIHESELSEFPFPISIVVLNNQATYLGLSNFETSYVWDMRKHEEILQDTEHWVWDLAFSELYPLVAVAAQNGEVIVWNIETGEWKVIIDTNVPIMGVGFSSTNSLLAIGTATGVRLWNVETYIEELEPFVTGEPTHDVIFSNDGNILIAYGDNSALEIINLQVETKIADFYVEGSITLSQEDILASFDSEGTIYFWDINTGDEIFRIEQEENITDIEFSPDNNFLVTTYSDGIIKIWGIG